MKLLILSDLHLEFDEFLVPEHDADVVVLAGDIHHRLKGILWAGEQWLDPGGDCSCFLNKGVVIIVAKASMGKHPERLGRLKERRLKNRGDGLGHSLREAGTGTMPSLWNRLGELNRSTLLVCGELDQLDFGQQRVVPLLHRLKELQDWCAAIRLNTGGPRQHDLFDESGEFVHPRFESGRGTLDDGGCQIDRATLEFLS